MEALWLSSSGSKSSTEVPSSGRPSLVVAAAVKSIASANWVLPVLPWPMIAILLSRPISSTDIGTPLRVYFRRGDPARGAVYYLLSIRTLHRHVSRDDSANPVRGFEQQRTVAVDASDHALLARARLDHGDAPSAERRVTLPHGPHRGETAGFGFHIASVEAGKKRIRNCRAIAAASRGNQHRGRALAQFFGNLVGREIEIDP